MMPTCPKCKTELPDKAKFCLECGYDLSAKPGEIMRACGRCGRRTPHVRIGIPAPSLGPVSGRIDNPSPVMPVPIPMQVPIQTMRCKICGQEITDVGEPPPFDSEASFGGTADIDRYGAMGGFDQGPNAPR